MLVLLAALLCLSAFNCASVHEAPRAKEAPVSAPFADLKDLLGDFDLEGLLKGSDLLKNVDHQELVKKSKDILGGLTERFPTPGAVDLDQEIAKIMGIDVEQVKEQRLQAERMLEEMKNSQGGFDFSKLFKMSNKGEGFVEEL